MLKHQSSGRQISSDTKNLLQQEHRLGGCINNKAQIEPAKKSLE
ncbi:MAG: hypothetical protein PHY74_05555 [Candidatus Bathyarchaeota archaeon]|nr:hypothetical protein [Candidatus Bathyarchaeota archaeon]MDD4326439.1 hypothetical protein [Candidatus Bathyarchaeota archaeon]